MKLFLKLKHWQVFLMMFAAPSLIQAIAFESLISKKDPSEFLFNFSMTMIIFIIVLFGWLYSLAINLHKLLPENINMPLTKFKFLLFFPLLHLIGLILFVVMLISDISHGINPNIPFLTILFLSHLFALYGMLYCFYFIAKTLKSVEWRRTVTMSDYLGEFFLLWFYPIGIWFIQPRINKLFNSNNTFNDNEHLIDDKRF